MEYPHIPSANDFRQYKLLKRSSTDFLSLLESTAIDPVMAFLFPTSLYLFSILFYSISHCLSIGGTEGWGSGLHTGFGEFRAPSPSIGQICSSFNFLRVQKLICLFCKGIDPSCFGPSTTSRTSTTTASTSTTKLTTTTPATTTSTTTTTTTTTPAPE